MEREALRLLEKRVEGMRVVAAEKAVLARSLSYGDPPRFHAEISTALLALVVFAVFMIGREAGTYVARTAPCPGLRTNDYAVVWFSTASESYTLDTKGDVWERGKWTKRLRPSATRYVIDLLVRGCFLERLPPSSWSHGADYATMSLSVGHRYVSYPYYRGQSTKLCGSDLDIGQVEQAIRNAVQEGID
jgi:hypothetical protein